MNLQLQFASLLTLGVLSGFVLAIILAIAYVMGDVSWQAVIITIILYNVLAWLISPYINDLIYRWLYRVTFYEFHQIKNERYAKFVKRICDRHGIPFPKIGIIKDQNPTAFTYGSGAFNARIVFTQGLFHFLNEEEIEAVLAHEVGHIKNKDFIIMTIAATLLQILYEMYVILTRSRSRSASFSSYGFDKKGRRGDPRAILHLIGWVSYLFYWLGTYVLLFLSRMREYYADEFSAKETGNPNALSSALIKIAYGIAAVPDTERTAHLLNNTRAQGIYDIKAAHEMGLVATNSKGKRGKLENALLFDLVNPWAWFFELKSTHPLTGKRIRRLGSFAKKPMFDFMRVESKEIDRGRMWKNFARDFFMEYLGTLLIIAFIVVFAFEIFYDSGNMLLIFSAFLVAVLLAGLAKMSYKYPVTGFQSTTIEDCMGDIYASPVRGKPIKLEGKAIGRGQAGFMFGEDMMFQDKSGIIFLNYEGSVPLFSNLVFAWKKLESLLQKQACAQGWFLRGATHHIELDSFSAQGQTIKSWVRFWAFAGWGIMVIILGVIAYVLLPSF